MGRRREAQRDVLLPPALPRGGVALVDILMEEAEDGVTVGEGAQEGGDGPDLVLHYLIFTILDQLSLGQKGLPDLILADYPGEVRGGGVQDNHVFLFIGPQKQEQDVTQLGDRDAKAFWKENRDYTMDQSSTMTPLLRTLHSSGRAGQVQLHSLACTTRLLCLGM